MQMAKSKRAGRSSHAETYAESWRQFLKELLKAQVRTRKEREDLAEAMGISIHYLNSMLYRQEGGIDAWASALSIAYDLKPKDIGAFFAVLKTSLRKTTPLSKADEVWQQLGEMMSESEKHYWVSLLYALVVA